MVGSDGVPGDSRPSDSHIFDDGVIPMKRTSAALSALAISAACSAFALDVITDRGTWPKSWPSELEPLRPQARTVRGGAADTTFYDIPFTKREELESAWPHILAVKTKGAPIILVRGPVTTPGGKVIRAGVRIHCPPGQVGEPVRPAGPIPGQSDARHSWLGTNYIELFVDGDVVDLNRIPIPEDTPMIDERFMGGGKERGRK